MSEIMTEHVIDQSKRFFHFEGEATGKYDKHDTAKVNDATIDITGGVTIEEWVHFGHQVMVLTTDHPTDVLSGKERQKILRCSPVVIKRNAYIGSRAMILKGVTVGESAYVAAGAVVIKDVLPFTVVAGVPAKEIKQL